MVPAAPHRAVRRRSLRSSGLGRYHRRVRKLIKIAIVALGVRALLRWWKRRQTAAAAQTASVSPPASDPAVELRQKLADAREEIPAEPAVATEASVEDRRADVHEQGRTALDEMKPSDES